MVEDIPETTKNLVVMFEKLGFPLIHPNMKFVSDIKLLEIVLGLHGAQVQIFIIIYCNVTSDMMTSSFAED